MPNYFPTNYPQYYPQQYQNPYQAQTQSSYQQPLNNQTNSIIWVQGEGGAKAYPVPPGANVLLMDSEDECFYIKSADASGMPLPLRTFEYKEIVSTQKQIPQYSEQSKPEKDYVSREEYNQLLDKVEQLSNKQSRTRGDKGNAE